MFDSLASVSTLFRRHPSVFDNSVGQLTHAFTGFIPGELSFAANSRELERTRANGVRRTFAGVRRSSLGFARVRAYSAANWRTVRQKIRSPEEISTSVRRERGPPRTWFAANEVRRELRSRRTTTLANSFAKNF